MSNKMRFLAVCFFILASCSLYGQSVPSPVVVPDTHPTELITPINPNPISIDEALQRRMGIIGKPARKVILFICDGMGAPLVTLARAAIVGRDGMLALDRFPTVGRMICHPIGGQVCDSAAAGSQFATGKESLNRHISMDADKKIMPTIFEEAHKLGYRIGLVSDTRLSHATPAVFSAHQCDRGEEKEIAAQQIKNGFEVMLSGGRNKFKSSLDDALKSGYKIVGSRKELLKAVSAREEKVLGLFADSFMPYSFERKGTDAPLLSEMAAAAVSLLDRGDKGFLLMVEAGSIDATMHAHDACEGIAQMRYMNDALQKMVEFVKTNPDALLVVISDHATGGIQVTELFDPEKFNSLATSSMALASAIHKSTLPAADFLKTALPAISFSDDEIKQIEAARNEKNFEIQLGSILFEKFGITFHTIANQEKLSETHGHTGEDLFIHAMGAHQHLLGGVMRAWEIPRRIGIAIGIRFP